MSKRNFERALLALLVLVLAACSGETDEPRSSKEQEGDLDSLDLANSWTTAADPANPDAAGPIWWPSYMKRTGVTSTMRAVIAGHPTEPVGVFAAHGRLETGAFSLAGGSYGFLIQFKENRTVTAGTLGAVVLDYYSSDDSIYQGSIPLGHLMGGQSAVPTSETSGGWRRGYVRFTVKPWRSASPDWVFRLRIDGTTTVEWQVGLVALHREARPFFVMAHNPNSIARLDDAVADGATAIEPDLRASSDDPGIAEARDGYLAVTEEGLTKKASDSDGQSTLAAYLQELNRVAPWKMILWDTKIGANKDYLDVGRDFRNAANREGFILSQSVMNITDSSMARLFDAFADRDDVGRCYDGIFTQVHSHTASEWMDPVRRYKLTFQGLGVTPLLQVTEKWSVPIGVYVRAREQEEYPRKIYFWTVNDAWRLRRILDLGVDSMITDDIPLLRSILREQPYATMFKLAGDYENPHVKHGGKWFTVRRSEYLQ